MTKGRRAAPATESARGVAVADDRARAREIIRRLREEYPDARCSLNFENPFQLLVATILSAQCTDERVNQVTPALFARYPTPEDLAGARQEELEELIHSTGFYRNKAKSLLGMAARLVEEHGGRVPDEMEALVRLPGVGRKTANVVLGNAFGKAEGVVVDTHVKRLAGRLGLSRASDPDRIEQDLMELVPREDWTDLAHLFIYHGRAVCKAPRPRCEACRLAELCPSAET
ncbi:MAG TPA: endonuclease III [Longimicrobiales bacterium]